MSSGSSVTVALRVKASPERAFDVFAQDIGAWWRPNVAFATTPKLPGVLSFQGQTRLIETLTGGKVFEIGRVTAWDRPNRLAFTWRQAAFPPDLITEVEVLFEQAGDETRVSIEHRGFERVPAGNAARHGLTDLMLLQHLAGFWRGQLAAYRGVTP
jgi:uncharacterized protein YndB with AHSA1/START domain